jgi:endogenous inhibitor of DNA gyrase (YacG/DUF329 family)
MSAVDTDECSYCGKDYYIEKSDASYPTVYCSQDCEDMRRAEDDEEGDPYCDEDSVDDYDEEQP